MVNRSTVIRRRPVPAPSLLADVPPVLQRVYAARGITDAQLLTRSTQALARAQQFKGMEQAVALLMQAVEQRWQVTIVGDFDADGATSTALCMLALPKLGLECVNYLVPNRFDFGYGLTPPLVDIAAQRGTQLILTVDNGISSIAGVERARELGIKVIVTDHHLPAEQRPAADAIVNPNQHGCDFPSKHLAGVGVAFYLMLALRQAQRQQGFWRDQHAVPNLGELLDLVALGTVADVVQLDHNNRILVYQGLQRIRAGRCRPGLLALCEVSGRQAAQLAASDLGFALGPRLNAAGRLDDMEIGIELLLTDDPNAAKEMALSLDSLNRSRKDIEQGMEQQALTILQTLSQDESALPTGLCLYQPDWHQGVVGILASRLKERFHRPVIAFAATDDGSLKGSARSVGGLHMRDLLERINARHPTLIDKFGGHAMAAGMTLAASNFAAFRAAFEEETERSMSEDMLTGEMLTDGALTGEQMTLETAQILRDGGPWGQGFDEPVFDDTFEIIQQRLVGQRHLKLVLRLTHSDTLFDAIAFNIDPEQWPNPEVRQLHVAYQLDINHFRGETRLQLLIRYLTAID